MADTQRYTFRPPKQRKRISQVSPGNKLLVVFSILVSSKYLDDAGWDNAFFAELGYCYHFIDDIPSLQCLIHFFTAVFNAFVAD
jgi:hypothetical protein